MQHSQAVELGMFLVRYSEAAAAALCMALSSSVAIYWGPSASICWREPAIAPSSNMKLSVRVVLWGTVGNTRRRDPDCLQLCRLLRLPYMAVLHPCKGKETLDSPLQHLEHQPASKVGMLQLADYGCTRCQPSTALK